MPPQQFPLHGATARWAVPPPPAAAHDEVVSQHATSAVRLPLFSRSQLPTAPQLTHPLACLHLHRCLIYSRESKRAMPGRRTRTSSRSEESTDSGDEPTGSMLTELGQLTRSAVEMMRRLVGPGKLLAPLVSTSARTSMPPFSCLRARHIPGIITLSRCSYRQ